MIDLPFEEALSAMRTFGARNERHLAFLLFHLLLARQYYVTHRGVFRVLIGRFLSVSTLLVHVFALDHVVWSKANVEVVVDKVLLFQDRCFGQGLLYSVLLW